MKKHDKVVAVTEMISYDPNTLELYPLVPVGMSGEVVEVSDRIVAGREMHGICVIFENSARVALFEHMDGKQSPHPPILDKVKLA